MHKIIRVTPSDQELMTLKIYYKRNKINSSFLDQWKKEFSCEMILIFNKDILLYLYQLFVIKINDFIISSCFYSFIF